MEVFAETPPRRATARDRPPRPVHAHARRAYGGPATRDARSAATPPPALGEGWEAQGASFLTCYAAPSPQFAPERARSGESARRSRHLHAHIRRAYIEGLWASTRGAPPRLALSRRRAGTGRGVCLRPAAARPSRRPRRGARGVARMRASRVTCACTRTEGVWRARNPRRAERRHATACAGRGLGSSGSLIPDLLRRAQPAVCAGAGEERRERAPFAPPACTCMEGVYRGLMGIDAGRAAKPRPALRAGWGGQGASFLM